MKRSLLLALVPSLCLISPGRSDEPPSRVTLTLHPAAGSVPALRNRLLPNLYEKQKGNAVPMYAKAMLALHETGDDGERRKKLLAGPLSACTKEAVDALVGNTALDLVRLAALREHCDWDLPLHERNMISLVLPELQQMRSLATLVVLKARAQTAAGDYAAALETLRTAYSMARHLAETPLLINGLAALVMQGMADEVLLEMVQQPGAPNLYWCLTALPRPLVDERRGYEGEMQVLDFTWRRWNGLLDEIPDDAAIAEFLKAYSEFASLASSDTATPANQAALAAAAEKNLRTAGRRPDIREYVVRAGFAEERLRGLSDLQLAMVFSRLKHDELRDDTFRWISLPYAEAKDGLQAATERLAAAKTSQEEILPLASMLVPAVKQVRVRHARAQRRIDVLRLIEALRLYAAEHDGRLPKSLGELQARTPIPTDVVTGKPPEYRTGDGVATLTLPEEFSGRDEPLVYEIRIAAKK